MKKYTSKQLLALPMSENDAKAKTIGGYLRTMFLKLWREGSDFNGKRPFGTSLWKSEIQKALIIADAIHGDLDDDGFINHADDEAADRLIGGAIESLFK